jgi:2-polyprenyl-6-methoxyphenol hydroxylase-like FAD-dependent oxidoreductase
MGKSGTAVVIGASMGGLLAARALCDTYAHVTVIDRDLLPDAAASRRGVPQGRQLHVLLARGREALDELFPGLTDELVAMGVPAVDLHEQVDWVNNGYPMRKAPSTLHALGLGRPLLEHAVRSRVAALPGVVLLSGYEATGLVATQDARRVVAVQVQERGNSELRELRADLIVDASGRASRMPRWLTELGYPTVREERVPVDITYVTRLYHREPGHLGGLLGVLTNATPEIPRTGVIAAQDGGQFAIALSGMLGDVPPTDDAGMAAFARTLAAPHFAELLSSATPTTDPVMMRFPASQRRRYEKMRRFPDGLLVMADAMCSFNPVYGQGMTVAALQALLLQRLLAQGTPKPRDFFRRAAKLVDRPWSISVGSDLKFPGVSGPRTMQVRFVNAYIDRLHAAATADRVLGAAFLRVINLIDPPTRLLDPRIVARVVRGARPQRYVLQEGLDDGSVRAGKIEV